MPLPPSEQALALAGDVLAKIAAYDPHFPKPNQAMLTAWAEHISLRNPDREDMLAAVTRFYDQPHDRIPMPFDISNIARQMQRDRLDRNPPVPKDKAIDAVPESTGEKITMAEWEERHGEKFPKLKLGRDLDENPLRFRCPWCKATEGNHCTIPGTAERLVVSGYHDARIAVAEGRCADWAHFHVQPHTEGCERA